MLNPKIILNSGDIPTIGTANGHSVNGSLSGEPHSLNGRSSIQLLGPGDFACADWWISTHFHTGGNRLLASIEAQVGKPADAVVWPVQLRCPSGELELRPRLFQPSPVKDPTRTEIIWTFQDTPENRQLLSEFAGRPQKGRLAWLAKDEVAINSPSLIRTFRGVNENTFTQVISRLGNPNTVSPDPVEIVSGEHSFRIFPRLKSNGACWAIANEQSALVGFAHYFGLELQTIPMARGEISCDLRSKVNFSDYFLGDSKSLQTAMTREFGSPRNWIDNRKQLNIDGVVVEIFGRYDQSGRLVVVFHEKDAPLIAKRFKVGLRAAADNVLDDPVLIEALVKLQDDPARLAHLVQFLYPHLSPRESLYVYKTALSWIDRDSQRGAGCVNYPANLEALKFTSTPPAKSKEHHIRISGKAPRGVEFIQIEGSSNRRVKVAPDGTFKAIIPLPNLGHSNSFTVYGVRAAYGVQPGATTVPMHFEVAQLGQARRPAESFREILSKSENAVKATLALFDRRELLVRELEISLLRHFTYDEEAGFKFLSELIDSEHAAGRFHLSHLYEEIQTTFRSVQGGQYPIAPSENLFFFQKYCVYKIHQARQSGRSGLILGLEPRMGKSLISLCASSGEPLAIVCPNSTIGGWERNSARFFPQHRLKPLEGKYVERDEEIAGLGPLDRQLIFNVEYLRHAPPARTQNISSAVDWIIIDEGDYLGKPESRQSIGSSQLNAGFKLILTASVFRKPEDIPALLRHLHPDDSRYHSLRDFEEFCPVEAAGAKEFMQAALWQDMLRLRWQDCFYEIDINQPLESQPNKLPLRRMIDPDVAGAFYLGPQVTASILELYTDYPAWCHRHLPAEVSSRMGLNRDPNNFFSKSQMYRQLINNPGRFGIDEASSKQEAVIEIAHNELSANPSNKLVIMCEYRDQVAYYAERLKSFGVALFYGATPRTSRGYALVGRFNELLRQGLPENDAILNRQFQELDVASKVYLATGRDGYFAREESGFFKRSFPNLGRPIRAIDLELEAFQNLPGIRVLIATSQCGGLGVGFTAGTAMIIDDLPRIYRDFLQIEARLSGIDTERPKYETRIYRAEARYDPNCFGGLPPSAVEKYLLPGTYDQVLWEGLIRGRIEFERMVDGIPFSEIDSVRDLIRERLPALLTAK